MRTLHLVSHTHWDREWYRTFQQFRLRLVHLVDGVLDQLQAEPQFRYFMLDGQTIVLDDYLQMRPENEEHIRHFVRTGRLTIGPWHILPDEYLVSPEATIRNLLEGERTCRRFGPKMRIGYIPDPFGHIGQMPQILRGFGIHAACVQRGLSDEPCEFYWQGPDGSQVFMAYLRDGYGNAASLPTSDPKKFVVEVKRLRDSLAAHSTPGTSHFLLMFGTDHMEPPADTIQAIENARGKLDGDELVLSSLADYLTGVQGSSDTRILPLVKGELRSPKRSHMLPAILSTRMWIKQRNRASETLLEKWVEPFSTFAALTTTDNRPQTAVRRPSSIVRQTWRLLMENHPHDSICGCSIDQVHDEMKVRFDQVDQIGEELTRQSLEALAATIQTDREPQTVDRESPSTVHRPPSAAVVVFNPTSSPRTDVIRSTLDLPAGVTEFDLVDETGASLPYQQTGLGSQEIVNMVSDREGLQSAFGNISDGNAGGMAVQAVNSRRAGADVFIDAVLAVNGQPNIAAWKTGLKQIEEYFADPTVTTYHVRARSTSATNIIATIPDVPGLGWRTLWIRPREAQAKPPIKINPLMTALLPLANQPFVQKLITRKRTSRPPYKIENEFFTVEAQADGTLHLLDKRDGTRYTGLNRFQDGGDCGDEYNFCAPPADRVTAPRLKGVTVTRGPVQQTLELDLELDTPLTLSSDRKSRSKEHTVIRLSSTVILSHGVPRVDIHTRVDNRARDHRLRVHFPAPFAAATGLHDGHFEVVERPVGVPAFDKTWVEEPRPEVPQRAFTSVTNGAQRLTVANRGLPEVEVLKNAQENAEIAVTLLRCVGWLSRDDFSNRKGHAGPFLETPGAQMIGEWEFDYSIIVGRDSISSYQQAWAFESPMRVAGTRLHDGILPARGSFVDAAPAEFVISAVKQAEDSKGWIVRGYNVTGEEVKVSLRPWRVFKNAERVDLAEERTDDLKPNREGAVAFPARGHEIVTVKFWD
jgi:mannosylglycerate hydrolase